MAGWLWTAFGVHAPPGNEVNEAASRPWGPLSELKQVLAVLQGHDILHFHESPDHRPVLPNDGIEAFTRVMAERSEHSR